MASSLTSYVYTAEMVLLINNKSYVINQQSIQSILLVYDYDKNNMPIIYLKLRITSDIYNRMVLNSDRATVSFRLFKSVDNGLGMTKSVYIEDNFLYIMSSDPNYYAVFEEYMSGGDTSKANSSYLEGYIGLISIQNINDNKKLFNNILKNTNLISIIHKYTNHMNMCIEPLDNNVRIRQFIIPPITSITNLIEYIDSNYYLYNSGYRFFRDYNMTYLLSTKGISVRETNNRFDTVIVSIEDPANNVGNTPMDIDKNNHSYIIHVNAKDTSVHLDRIVDKQYNSIIGVDTQGNTNRERLSIPTYSNSTRKAILERTSNNNLNRISNTKSIIESMSIFITVSKTEIDSTVLTPNKEYYIKNFNNNKAYDGRYILSYKKEILYPQDGIYKNSVMFGLRKAIEG